LLLLVVEAVEEVMELAEEVQVGLEHLLELN